MNHEVEERINKLYRTYNEEIVKKVREQKTVVLLGDINAYLKLIGWQELGFKGRKVLYLIKK